MPIQPRLAPKTGRTGLYAALLLITILLMVALRQCSAPRPDNGDSEVIAGGDTVNVAIEYSPLAVMSMGGDSLGGFGYEMISRIAAREGLVLKFHPIVKLRKALVDLDSGQYDILIAELPMTAAMKRRYRMTEPIFLDRQVLIQKLDSNRHRTVESQLDLGGRRVTVVGGSPAVERLRNLSREIGDTIYIDADSLHSPEQIFLLTAAGELPLAVVNASTARALSSDYPDMDISTDVSFTQFRSWVLTGRDSTLANTLDSAIVRFMTTPEFKTLLRRYHLDPVR